MGSLRRIKLSDADKQTATTPATRLQIIKPSLTILDAINDPLLFKPWFCDKATWTAWVAFLCSLFALDMTDEQAAVYRACTGRTALPTEPAKEAWLIAGRRAGKSVILALIAVFLACFHDFKPFLAPGERGTVFVIATDRKQARIILRYIRAFLHNVSMLKRLVTREWAEGFDLSNSVTIEVATASFRSVRGFTLVAVLMDEIAFLSSEETANPDYEILNALRPGMATIPNAMLLCASSPYARKGALWDAYRRHFGKDGDPIACWQASTRAMNPSVPQSFIDAEIERDPANAAAEFGANFRNDIEAFISREAIEAVVSTGVRERPPITGIKYSAFVDPSGGSADSFTLAIAHLSEDKVAILDAIRERKPPFSPEDVVSEFADLLKLYGINKVIGDRYAGEFPRELFRKHGITYEAAAKPKSDLYRETLPLINSLKCDLLDHPKLVTQLLGLERRTARSGKDSIDHAPNGHDDIANSVAGALTNVSTRKYRYDASLGFVGDPKAHDDWLARQRMAYLTGGRL